MHRVWRSERWLIAVMLTILGLTTSTAIAHERRDVGPYKFVVGFLMASIGPKP